MGFENLLKELEENSNTNTEKGFLFEKLVKQLFIKAKPYCERYEQVWLWNEFPYVQGHDVGIDLIAKIKGENEYAAIQCKFYNQNTYVQKKDVDTFISASNIPFTIRNKEYYYSEKVFISTTDNWSSNAEYILQGKNNIQVIRFKDLEQLNVNWDGFNLNQVDKLKIKSKKDIRPHQRAAIDDVINGFKESDRGKLIMACGTGKTFTSLKIAEEITKGKGNVLFLVPSISLLNQSLIEWTSQCSFEYNVMAICSDSKASRTSTEDLAVSSVIIPATTDYKKIVQHYNKQKKKLNLFFSTYQSLEVIKKAQDKLGIKFDIVICDEAHRTTGVSLSENDESNFVKIHKEKYIKAKKRLYMTATPKVYGDETKNRAKSKDAILCSMDDEKVYGKEFHKLGFSKAVNNGLLCDYKVVVLAVDESYVSESLQKLLTDEDNELKLDDAVKIMGCLSGISKIKMKNDKEDYFAGDYEPMKKIVSFSSTIKNSKTFMNLIELVQEELINSSKMQEYPYKKVKIRHVDGTMNSFMRKNDIDWLKNNNDEESVEKYSKILTNAKCLSEGIDVPALDGVIFLNPKKSQIDIIQAVGRVMRVCDGKKYGYILLPVGIPSDKTPEEALKDNKKYEVVWQVLQALRAHDDRYNITINQIELNKNRPNNISIIGVSGEESNRNGNKNIYENIKIDFSDLREWKNNIYAKIVQKCGEKHYWENWAKDVGAIAKKHIEQINRLIKNENIKEKFEKFIKGLQTNLNPTISSGSAIEMLAEHMITKPIFDALFEGYDFVKNNPVSKIMEDMIKILHENSIEKEQVILEGFYKDIKKRAEGIDNAEGKQKIIIELYESFFKNVLPKQVEKLGIVYTPTEVVDFIINSVEVILNEEFNKSINDKNVTVIDPFTGTGTFIVRLLQSCIINKENILYKYQNEIFANEIVLLAYYIAAINIEETFHDIYGKNKYIKFNGLILTDTFELSENKDRINSEILDIFRDNYQRAKKELNTPIKVIIGNPPYSVGQKSANDDNQNVSYPKLDAKIADTYVKDASAGLTRNCYDSYIKAFRWATDRLDSDGIVSFVTNGSYIDNKAFSGFRKHILQDFTGVYVFNLRGNARKTGEERRKEKDNVFGQGTQTPVSIIVLVKNSKKANDNFIHYYDIGDYLTKEQKLYEIKQKHSIKSINWECIIPNEKNDWINQRNDKFDKYIGLAKYDGEENIFKNTSTGVATSRDIWMYGFNKKNVKDNANKLIKAYNKQMELKEKIGSKFKISNDSKEISWSRALRKRFDRNKALKDKCEKTKIVMYRPFTKKYLADYNDLIETPSMWKNILTEDNINNEIIAVSGTVNHGEFSILVSNVTQDLQIIKNCTCLPLYYSDNSGDNTIFNYLNSQSDNLNINKSVIKKFQEVYKDEKITGQDIFAYIYALLHSEEYRLKYGNYIYKDMPRIPFVKDIQKYINIGKTLMELHIDYESVIDYKKLGIEIGITKNDFKVEKMRFLRTADGKEDKTTIIYNEYITIKNIPIEAYNYIVNRKPAIEWIMDQYSIKENKETGIIDNPNEYAPDNEKYILNLLISVVNVSIETLKLIKEMPKYEEIETDGSNITNTNSAKEGLFDKKLAASFNIESVIKKPNDKK